jgi:uncharacterized protein YfbU (UPF0304 family)
MAQLNIRLDDHSRDLLDALARARGLTTSDLVRELIAQALGRGGDADRPREETAPRSLSAVQRRRLALQHETLALLTADEQEDDGGWESQYHRQMVEVLNAGYVAEYYRTFQMIEPEFTDRESGLVHDILEMFDQIEWSLGELDTEDRAALGDVTYDLSFRGFDFNDSRESRLASYARFLIKDGRWERMAEHFDARREHGNSHMPMLATYQRMLSVFKPLWEKKIKAFGGAHDYRLTLAELQEIRAARPYPRDDAR